MQPLRRKPRRFYRRVPSLTRILPYFYNAVPSFPPRCRTKSMQNVPDSARPRGREDSVQDSSSCRLPKWWNGRHARLRGVWRKPCGFKSRLRHQLILADICICRFHPSIAQPKRTSLSATAHLDLDFFTSFLDTVPFLTSVTGERLPCRLPGRICA